MKGKVEAVLRKVYYSRALIWALLAYGVLTRFLQYLSNRSIWFDESLLVMNILERGYLELLSPLDNVQAAPPAFLLLTKLLTQLFGHSTYVLRLLPFLAGVAALFLFAKLAGELLGPGALPPALALLALADRAIYYSAEAKQYSVELLVTVIILLLAARLYRQSYRLKETVVLGLAGALLIWCAYPSVFVLAGAGAVLFFFAWQVKSGDRGGTMIKLGVIAGLWLASFALNYYFIAGPASRNEAFYHFFRNDFLPFPPASLSDLGWFPQTAIDLFCHPLGFSIPHAALVALIIAAGAVALWKRKENHFALCLILLPLAVLAAASAMHFYPIANRMVLFAAPLFYLLIGEGFYQTAAALSRRSLAVPLVLAAALFSTFLFRSGYHLIRPRLNEEARPVIEYCLDNREPGDEIYVFHESYKVFEYYTYKQDVSYIPGVNSVGDPRLYREELDALVGKGRVWFIFSHDVAAEEGIFREHLDQIGEMLDFSQAQNAMAYLYDLGDGTPEKAGQLLVPEEFASIQEAIEASVDGDLIVVKPGVYHEHIDFLGKEIVVQSSDPGDPDIVGATIIEAPDEGAVVFLHSGEGRGASLSGFTITGGKGTIVPEFFGRFGGGILITKGSSPVISGNVIRDNAAGDGNGEVPGFGGGVAVLEASPCLKGNTILGNCATIEGGGIYIFRSDAAIRGNRIEGNSAKLGGGISVSIEGTPFILNNHICANRAVDGGGIRITAAAPELKNNLFQANIAEEYGGGISAWRSSLQLAGNSFQGNSAGVRGGAISVARDAALSPGACFCNSYKNSSPDGIFYEPADYS